MNTLLGIIGIGYRGSLTHIRNLFSLYFPYIFRVRPQAVDIYPTFRCNLKCVHCVYASKLHKSEEISTKEWFSIIEKCRRWLGRYSLRICGGEPFARSDLLEIVEFAHSRGLFTIVTTNGILIDQNMVKVIRGGILDILSISLEGVSEKINDSIRGKGTYRKIMDLVFLLKDYTEICINTTIMERNISEIISLVEFCEKNKLKISFQGLILKDDTRHLWPLNKREIKKTFEILIQKKKRNSLTIKDSVAYLHNLKRLYLGINHDTQQSCMIYQRIMKIMSDGTVKICGRYSDIGNIIHKDPRVIWNSEKAFYAKESIKHCKHDCSFLRFAYHESLCEKTVKLYNFIKPMVSKKRTVRT